MGTIRLRYLLALLLALLVSSAFSTSVTGQGEEVPALLLTNDGMLAEGMLAGILPTIRLDIIPYVGPAQAFDIPLSAIRQITLDFPRLVVETQERVYIGPFSTFTGISELLLLHQRGKVLEFPTASLRAIALHGNPLHPAPREWLGSEFLFMPRVLPVSPLWEEVAEVAPEEPSELIFMPTWEELYPTIPYEPEQEIPWWVSMLIVAALAGLIYLSLSAAGS